MALTQTTRPYEVLVRFPPAGSTELHAHQATITEYLEDGVIVSSRVNPPEVLDIDGIGAIVGPELPGLQAALAAARQALVLAGEERELFEIAATAHIAQVTAERDAALAKIAEMNADLDKYFADSVPG